MVGYAAKPASPTLRQISTRIVTPTAWLPLAPRALAGGDGGGGGEGEARFTQPTENNTETLRRAHVKTKEARQIAELLGLFQRLAFKQA